MNVARLQELLSKIIITNTCWQWTGAHTAKGYSESYSSKGVVYVHRFLYELINGVIPQKKVVDHTCDNTGCVNPKHLRLLSNAENIWRKYEDNPRTHCRRDHLLEGNSKLGINARNGRPRRWCLKCLKKEY